MASNRCTKLFVCPNGNTYTLSGPCWYVNNMQSFWVCGGLAPGRNPFSSAPPGTTIFKNGIRLKNQEIEEAESDKTFLQKYWLLLLIGGALAYYFLKKK